MKYYTMAKKGGNDNANSNDNKKIKMLRGIVNEKTKMLVWQITRKLICYWEG